MIPLTTELASATLQERKPKLHQIHKCGASGTGLYSSTIPWTGSGSTTRELSFQQAEGADFLVAMERNGGRIASYFIRASARLKKHSRGRLCHKSLKMEPGESRVLAFWGCDPLHDLSALGRIGSAGVELGRHRGVGVGCRPVQTGRIADRLDRGDT
jgi:hypothetical protein